MELKDMLSMTAYEQFKQCVNRLAVAYGATVTDAGRADEGLRIFRRRPFDLVIVADDLPDADALNTVRSIWITHPGFPVIGIVSEITGVLLRRWRPLGVTAFITPEMSDEELVAVVTNLSFDAPAERQAT